MRSAEGGSGHSLWGGRFDDGLSGEMEALNRSLDVDWRLWRHDIQGSRAWARGLARAGILSEAEASDIDRGLAEVGALLEEQPGPAAFADEDIHTVVERLLTERVGPVGGKLHSGRSRNDQVATDFRLWGKEAIDGLCGHLAALVEALAARARESAGVVMPGYTHLQQAQPVPVGHWLLSRAWPLVRDIEQLRFVYRECDVLPLGSGAIAGCPFTIDRGQLAADLGFSRVSENSMDAVSDRDWAARLVFGAAMTGVHLSQLAEDLVLFSTTEFGFVRLGDGFTTGSSLMPQKRNPDVAELTRGKSGRLVGNLAAMLTVLKGLPTGYNRDLQEDKEAVFDSVDTLRLVVPAITGAVSGMAVVRPRIREALRAEMLATDLADHLVRRGVPFRESHHIAGALVRMAEESGRELSALTLDEMRSVHPGFGEDVYRIFDPAASVESRAVRGGTSARAVQTQLDALARALSSASGTA
ncbi:MAG: argininosuccinate lyase [Gemmatimonadota bacterium]|nr:argininosuccinate lyase [Gemmatimonadota bacterium]MDE2865194.1 argininosuccinate lyase [Gemmatimonadota bacterium]MYE18125.1 argininosuccinate lyase [Gemmatimonadota bacterium]